MSNTSYTVIVKEDKDGSLYIDLPETIIISLGWSEDTDLEWSVNNDQSWTIRQVDST